MRMEDIDKEMKGIKASTSAAHKAFQEEDYVTAAKLFLAAADQLGRIYPADHPEVLQCFLQTGDSYYYLERFSEAAKMYADLEKTLIQFPNAPIDRPVLSFKIAKALSKSRQFDEAEKAYENAVEVCESLLPETHPLLTIVNEAHSGFVRHVRKNPAGAQSFEQRAQQLRERNKDIHGLYENYLEPLKRKMDPALSTGRGGDSRASGSYAGSSSGFSNDGGGKPGALRKGLIVGAVITGLAVVGLATGLKFRTAEEAAPSKTSAANISPADTSLASSSPANTDEASRSIPAMPIADDAQFLNLISNGSFEADRTCDENNPNCPYLATWIKVKEPVTLTKYTNLLGPSNGKQFLNLGETGEITHEIITEPGKSYTLRMDFATPKPAKEGLLSYSLEAGKWEPLPVEAAGQWTMLSVPFIAGQKKITLRIAAGPEKGNDQRYLDNVRMFETPAPWEKNYQ